MTTQAIAITTNNGLLNFADFDVKQREIKCVWTAATAGTVSFGLAATYRDSLTYKTGIIKIIGRIGKVTTMPTSGGTAPTADYSLTLLDDRGVDVLETACTSLSATTAVEYVFSPAIVVDSELTFTITGAGDGGQGTVTFWFVK